MTITDRPATPRPGRASRTFVYPAFARTGPDEPTEGTRGIYLYLRLSKHHHDGADAIERQRLDLLRKLNAEGGWTVLGEYIDNDSASASALRNRKGWRQLNQDIQAGKVPAVAFWKLDRTNRITSQCIEWIGQCQRAGVYLVSHQDSDQELNTATAGAKLITGIKALLAEVEIDSMSERQLAAKRHLAEAGFHHGGTPPLGWMAGPRTTDQHGRSGVRLVPYPVEHPALKRAVEMVLDGVGLARIAGFGKLALEALVLFLQGLGHRPWFCLGAVSVAPQPQGLLTNADLRGDGPDRTRTRTSLDRLTFQNQSDRALTQLWTVLLGHVPILLQLDRNQTQDGS